VASCVIDRISLISKPPRYLTGPPSLVECFGTIKERDPLSSTVLRYGIMLRDLIASIAFATIPVSLFPPNSF